MSLDTLLINLQGYEGSILKNLPCSINLNLKNKSFSRMVTQRLIENEILDNLNLNKFQEELDKYKIQIKNIKTMDKIGLLEEYNKKIETEITKKLISKLKNISDFKHKYANIKMYVDQVKSITSTANEATTIPDFFEELNNFYTKKKIYDSH